MLSEESIELLEVDLDKIKFHRRNSFKPTEIKLSSLLILRADTLKYRSRLVVTKIVSRFIPHIFTY